MSLRCPHCDREITVTLRARTDRSQERRYDHDAAAGLLKLGATQTEVANAYGVTRQAISQLAKKRGLA